MQTSRKFLSKIGKISPKMLAHARFQSANLSTLNNLHSLRRNFSTTEPEQEVPFQEPEVLKGPSSTHAFQTETKRLLDIVAKSLYTDKDVFLRELLSNASDAIEKQRYMVLTGKSTAEDLLQINLTTNEAKRQLIIQDTGIGMNKTELMENLGTIASSGSGKFLENLKSTNSSTGGLEDNLIGQFGVGFYSAFIIADTVEVISKKEGEEAFSWVSDGSGTYELSKVENFHLERGTKIIMHLKPECANYTRADELKAIIEKYSNFINHPIFINHEKVNLVTALWARDKRDIHEEEYRAFFEHISKSKGLYKYKIHYSTDVPLSIKALLYFPAQNPEMFGFGNQEVGVSLYCKKVLIKAGCREIIPNYLRFVKGVVDCEDLPLNISRENYQDSNLIHKIRNVVTKKILRLLEQESKSRPEEYLRWHQDFHIFLKEGLHTDKDNTELILSLIRFDSNFGDSISLDNYIEKLKPEQKSIYYFLAPNKEIALQSPYMEPFTKNEVPVLYLTINIEEMIFRQLGEYKKFTFVNIESAEAELPKELVKEQTEVVLEKDQVPEDDLQTFCMWIKNELQPVVTNVVVSKRLTDSPAVVVSQVSTGMRQMMAFMDKNQVNEMSKNLTLEINAKHPIVNKLNKMRKQDVKVANWNLKQLLDSCLFAANIPMDNKLFVNRINQYILKNLEVNLKEDDTLVENSVHNEVIVEENTGFNVLEEAMKESQTTAGKSRKGKEGKLNFKIDENGMPEIKD